MTATTKRIIPIILAIVLCFSLTSPVFAEYYREAYYRESLVEPGRELYCICDTQEAALSIASQYCITLVEFEYGVAIFTTQEDPSSVIFRGKIQGWPELSLNIVLNFDDPVIPTIQERKQNISAQKFGVISQSVQVSEGQELFACCNTEDEAYTIANLYGITLVNFEYGIAVYTTARDLYDVINEGLVNGYPELSINYIVPIDDPVTEEYNRPNWQDPTRIEHQGIPQIVQIVPGQELIACCDTKEEACAIASMYGITLVNYEYGVAVYTTERDLNDVINEGIINGYPPLSINYVVPIDNPASREYISTNVQTRVYAACENYEEAEDIALVYGISLESYSPNDHIATFVVNGGDKAVNALIIKGRKNNWPQLALNKDELPQIFNQYTITFEANYPDSSCARSKVYMSPINCTQDNVVVIPACQYTMTNWKFLGWSTQPYHESYNAPTLNTNAIYIPSDYNNCEGLNGVNDLDISFVPNQKVANLGFVNGCNVVLYAQWAPAKQYTVKTTVTSGGSVLTTTYKLPGIPLEIEAPYVYKAGYTLVGWTCGDGIIQNNGKIVITADKNVSYYPKWEKDTCTVVFDGNGATTGSMANKTYKTLTSVTLPANTYKRTGYKFTGWISYDGSTLKNQATVKIPEAMKDQYLYMYANWQPISYKIAFKANNGKGTQPEITATYDTYYTLPECNFVRNGYVFTGWKIGTDIYPAGATIVNLTATSGSTVSVTAQWAKA